MKQKKMTRRPYAAPSAELVCLIPGAPIATSSGPNWQWDSTGGGNWGLNSWGVPDAENLLNNASVTGVVKWIDPDELE